MNYRLLLHKNASKFIEKCNKKQREMIKQKLSLLQSEPRNHSQLVTTHPYAKSLKRGGVKWLQTFYPTAKAVELRYTV